MHKKVEGFSCGSECRRRENAGPVVHAGEETGAKKGESILRGEVRVAESVEEEFMGGRDLRGKPFGDQGGITTKESTKSRKRRGGEFDKTRGAG